MKFSDWLKLQEVGTVAGQPVAGTGGIQTTGMIAGVPKKLLGAPVSRKFAQEMKDKGLAGKPRMLKFNSK